MQPMRSLVGILVVAGLVAGLSTAPRAEDSAAGEQPWAEADPGAPPVPMLEPLHRRLPRFFLSHSLFYSPKPLLLRERGGSNCGRELPDLIGTAVDFDFRFWYLFVGSHLAVGGGADDEFSLREFALRGGAYIPFGERVALIHAFWIGTVDFDAGGLELAAPFEEQAGGEQEGLLLGTSLGLRIMLASWLGLTADVGLATTFLESGLAGEDTVRLNRWQVGSGLVFAW